MLTIESKPFILSIYSERETCWLHVSRTFLGLFKVIRCPYPDSQLTAQRYSSDIYWPVAELFKWFRIAKMWLIPFSIQFDLMIWIRKEKQSKWTNLFVFSSSSSSLLSIGWLDANGESIMQMRPRNIPLPRNTQYLHTMLLLLMLVLRIRDSGGFFFLFIRYYWFNTSYRMPSAFIFQLLSFESLKHAHKSLFYTTTTTKKCINMEIQSNSILMSWWSCLADPPIRMDRIVTFRSSNCAGYVKSPARWCWLSARPPSAPVRDFRFQGIWMIYQWHLHIFFSFSFHERRIADATDYSGRLHLFLHTCLFPSSLSGLSSWHRRDNDDC